MQDTKDTAETLNAIYGTKSLRLDLIDKHDEVANFELGTDLIDISFNYNIRWFWSQAMESVKHDHGKSLRIANFETDAPPEEQRIMDVYYLN